MNVGVARTLTRLSPPEVASLNVGGAVWADSVTVGDGREEEGSRWTRGARILRS